MFKSKKQIKIYVYHFFKKSNRCSLYAWENVQHRNTGSGFAWMVELGAGRKRVQNHHYFS